MERTGIVLLSFFLFFGAPFAFSQAKKSGPVILTAGAVWEVEHPDFLTDTHKTYRAVFDIMNSPEAVDEINPGIVTVARYLNMHAQQGVPTAQIQAAMVVHNKASKDLLQDAFYKTRYGVPNPNAALLRELMKAGVRIIFCGQSSASRDIPRNETHAGVELALSAMTALITLQDEGYRLIKF